MTTATKFTAPKFISYLRVSTKQQYVSGLGLEAQEHEVGKHIAAAQGRLLATYSETESGKRKDRPELAKALQHAKKTRSILIVAKLDRLARNVLFMAALLESKVEFVACDNPHANKFTVHILSAMAENEAAMISSRTKAALAQAKKRGVLLGSSRIGHWAGKEDVRAAAQKTATANAALKAQAERKEVITDIVPIITKLRGEGHTLVAIAAHLNELGHCTARGKGWSHVQILRLLKA